MNPITLTVTSEDPMTPFCNSGTRKCRWAPLYRVSGAEFPLTLSESNTITVAIQQDTCEAHLWRAVEQVRKGELQRGASGYMVIRHRAEIDKLYDTDLSA